MKDAKNNEHSYKTTASGQLEKDYKQKYPYSNVI